MREFCSILIKLQTMVKIIHLVSTYSMSYGKWLIWGALIMFIIGFSVLIFSVLSHDPQDTTCNCVLCVFNRVPQDGEYMYNRYLLIISMIWISVLILLVYVVRLYVNKQR